MKAPPSTTNMARPFTLLALFVAFGILSAQAQHDDAMIPRRLLRGAFHSNGHHDGLPTHDDDFFEQSFPPNGHHASRSLTHKEDESKIKGGGGWLGISLLVWFLIFAVISLVFPPFFLLFPIVLCLSLLRD